MPGARARVERCDGELRAGGVHAPRGTPRKPAAAGLVVAGAAGRRTALELFISVRAVQDHLTNVYAGFGIRSCGELAARFGESSTEV